MEWSMLVLNCAQTSKSLLFPQIDDPCLLRWSKHVVVSGNQVWSVWTVFLKLPSAFLCLYGIKAAIMWSELSWEFLIRNPRILRRYESLVSPNNQQQYAALVWDYIQYGCFFIIHRLTLIPGVRADTGLKFNSFHHSMKLLCQL